MTTHRYPRRILPLWYSTAWRRARNRLIYRRPPRPPEPWEPGYREWAADQAERISAFLKAARRDGR